MNPLNVAKASHKVISSEISVALEERIKAMRHGHGPTARRSCGSVADAGIPHGLGRDCFGFLGGRWGKAELLDLVKNGAVGNAELACGFASVPTIAFKLAKQIGALEVPHDLAEEGRLRHAESGRRRFFRPVPACSGYYQIVDVDAHERRILFSRGMYESAVSDFGRR